MHDLPEGPYFDWVGNIATAINRWRVSIPELLLYTDYQKALRQFPPSAAEYTCFDPKESILTYTKLEDDCIRKGTWREDSKNKWSQFKEDVGKLICPQPACKLSGLDWSPELAASASEVVERLSGCNVWAHNVKESLYDTTYLESIATFVDE